MVQNHTCWMASKLHNGTFKTKLLVPVHLGLPLFGKSHCATCSPARVILYHVTASCKEPLSFTVCRGDMSSEKNSISESLLYPICKQETMVLIFVPSANGIGQGFNQPFPRFPIIPEFDLNLRETKAQLVHFFTRMAGSANENSFAM